jgi:hypothetical protein
MRLTDIISLQNSGFVSGPARPGWVCEYPYELIANGQISPEFTSHAKSHDSPALVCFKLYFYQGCIAHGMIDKYII